MLLFSLFLQIKKMNIVIAEPLGLTPETFKPISDEWTHLGHDIQIFWDRNESPEILTNRIQDADILIISNIPLPKSILEQCFHLKLISVAFTGLDHIDLAYCKSASVEVRNCAGYATTAVAELTIGLILDLYRKITALDYKTRIGGTRGSFLGKQIKGKTIGIIGTGAIGSETAILAQHFGAKVIAYSRSQRQHLIDQGVQYLPLDQLVEQSDVISIHTPLTPETEHLLNESNLKHCKPSAILINTARGKVVEIHFIAEMLKSGKLAGAAFDVFETEPPLAATHPLLNAPNCIVVPHIAYATEESFEIRIQLALNNVKNFLKL
jgi:phosphoglycerate dehydrogenase-like enzyme